MPWVITVITLIGVIISGTLDEIGRHNIIIKPVSVHNADTPKEYSYTQIVCLFHYCHVYTNLIHGMHCNYSKQQSR